MKLLTVYLTAAIASSVADLFTWCMGI